jgi:hypothetical protein
MWGRFILVGVLVTGACEPPTAVAPPPVPTVTAQSESPAEPEDGCRRDIPDCSAACSLRATHHTEFIDWYDRRCTAVILGRNPDKAAGAEPPEAGAPDGDELLANPYR